MCKGEGKKKKACCKSCAEGKGCEGDKHDKRVDAYRPCFETEMPMQTGFYDIGCDPYGYGYMYGIQPGNGSYHTGWRPVCYGNGNYIKANGRWIKGSNIGTSTGWSMPTGPYQW